MKNSSVLVLIGKSSTPASLRGLAAVAREKSFHLSILVLGTIPPIPAYSYGIGHYGAFEVPLDWREELQENTRELHDIAEAFARMLSDEGVEADIRVLCSDLRGMRESIARRALTADIVLPAPDLRDQRDIFSDALQAALFFSPSGVLLNANADFTGLAPKRVFVAWNYGLQASRAVRAALPLLKHAREVTLGIFDPIMTEYEDGENPGSDVAGWLSHHGCQVDVQQFPGGGVEIGYGILKRAAECEADLIIMGAYDHSRMREIVFGGTTQLLVEQTERQVLLVH
jgi:nucleotide-binding universal stress UspA family protein